MKLRLLLNKEWIVSGQNVQEQVISVALPHAIGVNEEKALGLHWDVVKNQFFIRVDVSVGSNKVPLLPTLEGATQAKSFSLSDLSLPVKLTPRICLLVHAKTCNPLGFVLPTKVIGTLLFRARLQYVNQRVYRDEQKL